MLVICLDYTHLALHRRECAWLSRKQGCSCWLHKGRGCTGRKARSWRRRCVLLLHGSNHDCAARDPFHSSPGPGFARARVAALKGLVLWNRRPWGLRGGCFTFTPRALHGPRAIIRVLGRICISNNCFSKLQLLGFLEFHSGIAFELIAFLKLQLYNLRLRIAIVRFLELHSGISFEIIAFRNCNLRI